jgi:glutathione synthase
MKFAFIIDPIEKLNPGHDTSVALMEAAQILGHEVWTTSVEHLSVINGQAWGQLTPVHLTPIQRDDAHWVIPQPWFSVQQPSLHALEEMDAVFMRTDPPVTIPYLYTTYILDYVNPAKTLVVNSPQGLRAANEKMYALQFKSVIPDTIVSREKVVIRDFLEAKGRQFLNLWVEKGEKGYYF